MSQHPEFPLDPALLYLNHAAVAPWPLRTANAVRHFATENMFQGSRDYALWLATEARLRERSQRLLNAPSADDIALVKNTSEGLSFVAHGLPWRDGDNVVIGDREFPSNRIVWESLSRYGVATRMAPLTGDDPEGALLERVDERTRVLAISSVQYASGLRMDLARLGAACRERGVLFCVDAIQSLGAVRFDVQEIQADFAVADGHKWMLGPEGLGVFYCRAELRERLALHEYGWHMLEHAGDFDRSDWAPAASAQRFECGSANLMGAHALEASLSLLDETGMATVEERVLDNSHWLLQRLEGSASLEPITDDRPGRYAGIVTFRRPGTDNAALYQALVRHGVVCAQRGGGIRFSPHFYTPREVLQRACDLAETVAV